ncbi:hypothetical protein ACS0TY_033987 [Phlomoides rotata]
MMLYAVAWTVVLTAMNGYREVTVRYSSEDFCIAARLFRRTRIDVVGMRSLPIFWGPLSRLLIRDLHHFAVSGDRKARFACLVLNLGVRVSRRRIP